MKPASPAKEGKPQHNAAGHKTNGSPHNGNSAQRVQLHNGPPPVRNAHNATGGNTMKMHSLFSATFSNGDRMTGTLGQIYAAQDINDCRVTISPYITVAKAPAPIANDNGTMTGYALFVPALPFTGKFQQITGTYQRLTDAVAARNLLDEFDEVEFFAKYQRTF